MRVRVRVRVRARVRTLALTLTLTRTLALSLSLSLSLTPLLPCRLEALLLQRERRLRAGRLLLRRRQIGAKPLPLRALAT